MRRRDRHVGWDEYLIERFSSFLSRFGAGAKEATAPRKKFLGYNDLLELLKNTQCPVCTITRRSMRHYVATVFAEEVTSGSFRNEMRNTLGYCRKHSVFVKKILHREIHGLGAAIVYEDLLAQAQSLVMEEPFKNIPQQEHCRLCSFESELTDYAIQLVADYCDDSEFQNAYADSDGLCFPHVRLLCSRLNGDALKFILSEEGRKLSLLERRLSGLRRKNDYRFNDEQVTNEEANSWHRAMHFMAGDGEQ
jgi:Family of unknown function (DUF6062)